MSSSNSTSSNSDGEAPNKKKQNVTKGNAKPQEASCSDSDFVNTKKKSAKEQPSIKQQPSKDPSARLSFQQKLMSSNNKFIELLKNKQNVAEVRKVSNEASPIRAKGSSTASDSSEKKKFPNKARSSNLEFSPPFSSTQIKEGSFLDKLPSSTKKLKERQKEALSDSSDSENDTKSEKTKPSKVAVTRKHSSESASDSDSSDAKDNKKRKIRKKEAKELRKNHDLESNKAKRSSTKAKEVQQNSSDSDSEATVKNKQIKKSHSKNSSSEIRKPRRSSSTSGSSSDSDDKANIKSKKTVETEQNHVSQSDSDSTNEARRKQKKLKKTSPKIKRARDSSSESSSSSSERNPTVSRSSDSDSDSRPKISSKSQAQLRKFEECNESLSRVNKELDLLKTAALQNEVFLLQIPKGLDPKLLVGTKISLNEKTRVPEKGRKYDCIPSYVAQDPVAVSFNTESVHVIKPAGNIKLQRHLKSKHIPEFSGSSNSSVAFPSDLKERHPLFGANYEDKVSLEAHIQEKLKAAVESHSKQKKKKKKHKSGEIKKEPGAEEEEIFKFLSHNATLPDGKESRKSKKHSTSAEISFDEEAVKKKVKKEKHASILNFKMEADDKEALPDQLGKKRKHKFKKEKNTSINDTLVYGNAIFDEDNVDNPKLSKKRKFEDTDTDSSKKKKKKKKHYKQDPDQNQDDPFNLIDERLLSKSLETSSGKKKKKKHS